MKEEAFLKTLNKIHNFLYANEGLSRQEAYQEIIKLLFIKAYDESSSLRYFFIANKNDKTYEGRVDELFELVKKEAQDVFSKNERVGLKPVAKQFAVRALQNTEVLSFPNVAGAVFQEFVSQNQKAERGQFFTPMSVINLALQLTKVKKNDLVVDPACGGGGFLIGAILGGCKNVYGFEINKQVARIAKLGLTLVGVESERVQVCDSLQEEFELRADVILANPPFGSKGKIRNQKILSKYLLSQNKKSVAPEILFIEKSINSLKKGGRVAIVLPNGILENKEHACVRKYLRAKLGAIQIVDLPESTFAPYGTNVKTSLVVGIKGRPNKVINFGKFKRVIKDQTERLDYRFNTKGHSGLTGKKLGELCEIVEREKIKKYSGRRGYVEISSINASTKQIEYPKSYRFDELPKRAHCVTKEGDILYARVGNFIGTKRQAMALVDKTQSGMIASDGLVILRNFKVDPYYFLYFLASKKCLSQAQKYKRQTTIPSIDREDVGEIRVPLPSKLKMERVVAQMRQFIVYTQKAKNLYKKMLREV